MASPVCGRRFSCQVVALVWITFAHVRNVTGYLRLHAKLSRAYHPPERIRTFIQVHRGRQNVGCAGLRLTNFSLRKVPQRGPTSQPKLCGMSRFLHFRNRQAVFVKWLISISIPRRISSGRCERRIADKAVSSGCAEAPVSEYVSVAFCAAHASGCRWRSSVSEILIQPGWKTIPLLRSILSPLYWSWLFLFCRFTARWFRALLTRPEGAISLRRAGKRLSSYSPARMTSTRIPSGDRLNLVSGSRFFTRQNRGAVPRLNDTPLQSSAV